MQAKTHITTTLALGLPLMSLTNELTLINVGVLAVGSLLPDIDHPSSYLGKRHKMVSGVTNKAFGHRGITHSLLGFILIGIIVKFIQKQYLTDRIEDIVFWLMLGYLLHMLEDSLSQKRNMIYTLLENNLLQDENGKLTNSMKTKILELLGFGIWEGARDVDGLHIKRADKENLALLDGKEAKVKEIDDHELHIEEHIAFMLSGEYEQNASEKVEENFLKHIREHKKFKEGE